jgi:hypothetical protein
MKCLTCCKACMSSTPLPPARSGLPRQSSSFPPGLNRTAWAATSWRQLARCALAQLLQPNSPLTARDISFRCVARRLRAPGAESALPPGLFACMQTALLQECGLGSDAISVDCAIAVGEMLFLSDLDGVKCLVIVAATSDAVDSKAAAVDNAVDVVCFCPRPVRNAALRHCWSRVQRALYDVIRQRWSGATWEHSALCAACVGERLSRLSPVPEGGLGRPACMRKAALRGAEAGGLLAEHRRRGSTQASAPRRAGPVAEYERARRAGGRAGERRRQLSV